MEMFTTQYNHFHHFVMKNSSQLVFPKQQMAHSSIHTAINPNLQTNSAFFLQPNATLSLFARIPPKRACLCRKVVRVA